MVACAGEEEADGGVRGMVWDSTAQLPLSRSPVTTGDVAARISNKPTIPVDPTFLYSSYHVFLLSSFPVSSPNS
jgi:hypothetical protein